MRKINLCDKCGSIKNVQVFCDECKKEIKTIFYISLKINKISKCIDLNFCNKICMKKWEIKND